MQFKTYEDLNKDVIDNLYKIPQDIDLIVGIPRSGLLLALIIGLYLNLPVISLKDFLNEKFDGFEAGSTKPKDNWIKSISESHKILVVEDSVNSGSSLNNAKNCIQQSSILSDKCIYLSAYVTPESCKVPDIYFEIVNNIRMFQWNFLTHGLLEHACFDLDGVLCYDPTEVENDDGENYKHFLLNARVKLKNKREIGFIVTSRLEKYRQETELWLNKKNISYSRLYMMNINTASERRRLNNHAIYKAKVYKSLKEAWLFIESDDFQAREIFKLTNKPVFCIDSQQYYSNSRREKRIERAQRLKNKIKFLLKKLLFRIPLFLHFYKRYLT